MINIRTKDEIIKLEKASKIVKNALLYALIKLPLGDCPKAISSFRRSKIITLASIIQGEAMYDDEMVLISSVYHNRLNKDMLLQADPTIQYILPETKKRILVKHTKIKNPYIKLPFFSESEQHVFHLFVIQDLFSFQKSENQRLQGKKKPCIDY